MTNVARLTREDKKEMTPAQIQEAQTARLTPAEHRQLVILKEQAAERLAHREKHRFSLHDHVGFEPEAQRHRCRYGEPLERQKISY